MFHFFVVPTTGCTFFRLKYRLWEEKGGVLIPFTYSIVMRRLVPSGRSNFFGWVLKCRWMLDTSSKSLECVFPFFQWLFWWELCFGAAYGQTMQLRAPFCQFFCHLLLFPFSLRVPKSFLTLNHHNITLEWCIGYVGPRATEHCSSRRLKEPISKKLQPRPYVFTFVGRFDCVCVSFAALRDECSDYSCWIDASIELIHILFWVFMLFYG